MMRLLYLSESVNTDLFFNIGMLGLSMIRASLVILCFSYSVAIL